MEPYLKRLKLSNIQPALKSLGSELCKELGLHITKKTLQTCYQISAVNHVQDNKIAIVCSANEQIFSLDATEISLMLQQMVYAITTVQYRVKARYLCINHHGDSHQ